MYKKWRLNRALSYMSFLFTSGLKKIMSHEGALNSRTGTDAQVEFRVSVKTAYVLHSLTQGVLGPQLGGVFFFSPSRFSLFSSDRKPENFFFSQSESQNIFFRTKQNQTIFSKQHICSKCILSDLYDRVFLEPNIHGYNIHGYIVYMFVLGPRMWVHIKTSFLNSTI